MNSPLNIALSIWADLQNLLSQISYFPQPIAFTSDIDGSGVVKQSIQYSRSDDIIGEDTVLFSVRLTTDNDINKFMNGDKVDAVSLGYCFETQGTYQVSFAYSERTK